MESNTFASARKELWRRVSLLLILAATFISVAAVQVLKPRTRVLETVSTKAGMVKLLRRVDADIGETNWYVTLRGKRIYGTQDDVFGSVGFHSIFKSRPDVELILLREAFDVGGCTEFRLIEIRPASKATVTSRFGNCNNEPVITQSAAKLTFSFPAKSEPGSADEVWIYQAGLLTRQ